MAAAVQTASPFLISEDRLRVECIPARMDPHQVTAQSLIQRLKERGIQVAPEVTSRVDELMKQVQSTAARSQKPFLIAQGRPPVDGVGARMELAAANHTLSGDERADFYESRITVVGEGEIVGTLVPGTPPQPGVDVFGKPIHRAHPASSIEVGENIRVDADGKTLIATKAGKVYLTRCGISVLAIIEISGDVDFSTGNIDSPTDVLIAGTIRDTFAVKSARSVSVRGAIEAAAVEAGTDVQVSGGIAGRHQGRVLAGGRITSKYCSDANLEAAGDITITRECTNSHVHARGRLTIARGRLIGGFAYAREGAEIKVLGNEAEKPTIIALGADPAVIAQALQIDETVKKKREACAKIREKVQPLMAQLKRLTPQQRKHATELMCQADQIEAEVHEHEQQKRQLLASANSQAGPSLLVTSMVYPGVKVIFGDKMAIFRKERKGPIKIERRCMDRVEQICLIDECSGSLTIMPSYEYKTELVKPAKPT